MKRIDSLTSLRFFMIMMIVFSHFSFAHDYGAGVFSGIYDLFFANPNLAVDFFFILSGFGMMYSFMERGENTMETNPVACIRYAVNHVKKIYLVYMATVIVGLPLYFFNAVEGKVFIEDFTFLRFSQLVLTIPLLQSMTGMESFSHIGNGVAWFLSTLFCVYLISPVLLNQFKKIDNLRKTGIALIICILAFIFTCNGLKYLESNFIFDDLVYGSPYSRLFYVCVGMFVARLKMFTPPHHIQKFTIAEGLIMCVALSLILLKNFLIDNVTDFRLLWPYISMVVASMICYVFSFQEGRISRLLQNEKMVQLGNMSMFIFLIHYPLIVYLKIVFRFVGLKNSIASVPLIIAIALVATFAISWILYKRKILFL